ncbi:hypothetical protein GCM10018966_066570 [Streptomyces yanii]
MLAAIRAWLGLAGSGWVEHDPGGAQVGGDEVDVPVGDVVVVEPVRQPDKLARPVRGEQLGLDLHPGHAGIAVGVEQTLLGGDEGSLPVGEDGPALQDHGDAHPGVPQVCAHADGKEVVLVVRVLVAPAVEREVEADPVGLRGIDREDRAGVPGPAVVDRVLDDRDPAAALFARLRGLARFGDHDHRLEAGDGPGDAGHLGLDVGEQPAPRVMRGRFMTLLLQWDFPCGQGRTTLSDGRLRMCR